jgi:hypothetical protein
VGLGADGDGLFPAGVANRFGVAFSGRFFDFFESSLPSIEFLAASWRRSTDSRELFPRAELARPLLGGLLEDLRAAALDVEAGWGI